MLSRTLEQCFSRLSARYTLRLRRTCLSRPRVLRNSSSRSFEISKFRLIICAYNALHVYHHFLVACARFLFFLVEVGYHYSVVVYPRIHAFLVLVEFVEELLCFDAAFVGSLVEPTKAASKHCSSSTNSTSTRNAWMRG